MHLPKTPLFLAACMAFGECQYGHRRVLPHPAPPPAPKPAPKPPPAPSARCSTPPEKGVADAKTQLTITRQRIWFQPPAGWSYVRSKGFAVVTAPNSNAVLGFSRAHGSKPKQTLETLKPLLKHLHIGDVVDGWLKPRLRKPESRVDAGGEKISMWEVNKRSQFGKSPRLDGKPGSLLVVLAPLAGGATLVGAAFVVDPGAKTLVTDILHAVQSLRSSE